MSRGYFLKSRSLETRIIGLGIDRRKMTSLSSPLKELQSHLIDSLKAHKLAARPYYNKLWPITESESIEHAKSFNSSFRVYYLPRYIAKSEIRRLITQVPYICTAGDSYIQTQDLEVQESLSAARENFPGLINNQERRLSRCKCIASIAKCYAVGGFKSKVKPLPKSEIFDCIVVSGAGPQFEATYLDFADFILTEESHRNRLSRYSHFGHISESWTDIVKAAEKKEDFTPIGSGGSIEFVFHKGGYLVSMAECMHLWLTAFNDMVPMVSKRKSGYLKISAIGCGFFSDVARANTNIGTILMPILVKATETALKQHQYQSIAVIEFCDFSKTGAFAPTQKEISSVELIHGPRADILDFSSEVKEEMVMGLLNPSDCFACIGNETQYLSVESMIGDNTTIRSTQCYIWNEQCLNEEKYIAVGDPADQETSAVKDHHA